MNKKDELIQKYEEYIDLLGKEIDTLIGIAYIHGWKSKYVGEGEKLREEIKSLKNETMS